MKKFNGLVFATVTLILAGAFIYAKHSVHDAIDDRRTRLFRAFSGKPTDPPEAFYNSQDYEALLDDLSSDSIYNSELFYETSLDERTSLFMQECLWLVLSKKRFNFQRTETERFILKHPVTTLQGRLLFSHYVASGESDVLCNFVRFILKSEVSDKAKIVTWRVASAKSKKVKALKADKEVKKLLLKAGKQI